MSNLISLSAKFSILRDRMTEYSQLGATDTEGRLVFDSVVHHTLKGHRIEMPNGIWQLYDGIEAGAADAELSNIALRINAEHMDYLGDQFIEWQDMDSDFGTVGPSSYNYSYIDLRPRKNREEL